MISQYSQRINSIQSEIERLKKRDNYFNTARLSSFLLFILAIILSIDKGGLLLIVITAALLIAFVQIVLLHLKNQSLLHTETTRKKMLENEVATLELEPNSYYDGNHFNDPNHDYSSDMDVFGKGGLFHYISRCATGVGNRSLATWLASEHKLDEILQRQQAVKELAESSQWCEELRVDIYSRRIKDYQKENLPQINKTMATPRNLKIWISVSFSILAIAIAGIVFLGLNGSVLVFPVLFNIFLNFRMAKFTKTIRAQLEGREKTLNDYHRILTSFEQKSFHSSCLLQMQQELSTGKTGATLSIATLQGLSKKLDYSLNMLVGAMLNLFFIWDILICRKIAAWFDLYAPKTQKWFDVAGRLEALISLANIQNNHPDWTYPVFQNETMTFNGKNLGHPLIHKKERVCNDFNLTALMNIVTGSNMAGKSTFLRTIGVNTILAKVGAPVCADELILSHFRIMTYLTITDSLAENTSTFYREILRLKKILDSSRKDNNVLLLLDELLRGTNSADKAKGSMAITRELINFEVPSIIATHNLELADMKTQYPDKIENYYFDIIIDAENKMRFDYKLKHGVCDTFNASLLLKEIGIDISGK